MENASAYKWVVIIFFGVVGILFTASVIYLVAGNVAPDTYWGRKMTPATSNQDNNDPQPGYASDKLVLKLNQGRRFGNRVFFYRGCRDNRAMIDVIIPEIDQEYSYPFRIDLKEAKAGFELAGIRFRLITMRSHFISLQTVH
jgi:hypothetical protein